MSASSHASIRGNPHPLNVFRKNGFFWFAFDEIVHLLKSNGFQDIQYSINNVGIVFRGKKYDNG